jgi:cytochrome P450
MDSEDAEVQQVARRFGHHDEDLDAIFDTYREFRNKCPIGRSERFGGFWFLSRYEDVYQAEQEWRTFSVAPSMLLPPLGNERPGIPVDIDPPMHGKYRRILLRAFAPRQIDTVEPFVRSEANRLIDSFIDSKTFDASSEYATLLPMIVFTRMAGLPQEDYELYQDWVRRIFYVRTHDYEDTKAAAGECYAYFQDILRQRRSEPANDDLIGALLSAEVDGRPLTENELLDYCFTLLFAGLETTAWTIRSSLWHLAQHPRDQARLREDPELVATAVEEFLRCLSPVQGMARTLTQDVVMRETHLSKGERVLVLFGSGNRDEDVFPDADEVIVDRQPNRHFAFGVGIHRCLGSNLARREVIVALEELLKRLPMFRLAEGPRPPWHGIGPLPLTVEPS